MTPNTEIPQKRKKKIYNPFQASATHQSVNFNSLQHYYQMVK